MVIVTIDNHIPRLYLFGRKLHHSRPAIFALCLANKSRYIGISLDRLNPRVAAIRAQNPHSSLYASIRTVWHPLPCPFLIAPFHAFAGYVAGAFCGAVLPGHLLCLLHINFICLCIVALLQDRPGIILCLLRFLLLIYAGMELAIGICIHILSFPLQVLISHIIFFVSHSGLDHTGYHPCPVFHLLILESHRIPALLFRPAV